MTSEALQNPYFVRLYCKNIDKTHSLTEPNDKIQFNGNYFFKKRGGGTTLEKGGGGTDPLFPPPLNPPLYLYFLLKPLMVIYKMLNIIIPNALFNIQSARNRI